MRSGFFRPLGDDQRRALDRIDKGLAINGDTRFLILRDNALVVEEVALDQAAHDGVAVGGEHDIAAVGVDLHVVVGAAHDLEQFLQRLGWG